MIWWRENVEPNMKIYDGLIFACGKGGLHEDAKKILLHMNEKGIVPSSRAYTGVIEAYGQAALYEEALVAFNTMNEVESKPTIETYNSLLQTFARGGLHKEAEAILSGLRGSIDYRQSVTLQRNGYVFPTDYYPACSSHKLIEMCQQSQSKSAHIY